MAVLFYGDSVAAGYKHIEAVAYARKFSLEPNPEYPEFALDCTNFASQVLLAGGAKMSPDGESVASGLGITGGAGDWFVRKSDKSLLLTRNISRARSWGLANDLYDYLSAPSGRMYENRPVGTIIKSATLSSNSTPEELFSSIKPALAASRAGDMVFFDFSAEGRMSHATTITQAVGGSWALSYHSINRKDLPIGDFLNMWVKYRSEEGIVAPYKISVIKVGKFNLFDYVDGRKSRSIYSLLRTASVNREWFDKILSIIGLGVVNAQNSALTFVTGRTYDITVEGDNFVGNEVLNIDGAICGAASRHQGKFVQACTFGLQAHNDAKIRVVDSDFSIDVFVPPEYQSATIITPILAPNAPSLSEMSAGRVRLNWTAVSGAAGYTVTRNGVDIATLGAVTSFDDPGIYPASTQVCYRLRAISGNLLSSYSPEQCITTSSSASACTNQWNSGYSNIGIIERGTQACPVGQTGSISLAHTCGAGGVWGATQQTGSTCVTASPTSCANTWGQGTTPIGATESRQTAASCPAGQTGTVTDSHTCLATGQFGTTRTATSCNPVQCLSFWRNSGGAAATFSPGQTETFSQGCPAGQTGSILLSHDCLASGAWSATSTNNQCIAPITYSIAAAENILVGVPWTVILRTTQAVYAAEIYFPRNGKRVPLYGDLTNWESSGETSIFRALDYQVDTRLDYQVQVRRHSTSALEVLGTGSLLVRAAPVVANNPTITSSLQATQAQPYTLTVRTASAADRVTVRWPDSTSEEAYSTVDASRTAWTFGARLFMQAQPAAATVNVYRDGTTAPVGTTSATVNVIAPPATMRLISVSNNIIQGESPYFTVGSSISVTRVTVAVNGGSSVQLGGGSDAAERSFRGQVLVSVAGTQPVVITGYGPTGTAAVTLNTSVTAMAAGDRLTVANPMPTSVARSTPLEVEFPTVNPSMEMWMEFASPIGRVNLTGRFLQMTYDFPPGTYSYRLMRRDQLGNVFAITGSSGELTIRSDIFSGAFSGSQVRVSSTLARAQAITSGATVTFNFGDLIEFVTTTTQPVPTVFVRVAELSFERQLGFGVSNRTQWTGALGGLARGTYNLTLYAGNGAGSTQTSIPAPITFVLIVR